MYKCIATIYEDITDSGIGIKPHKSYALYYKKSVGKDVIYIDAYPSYLISKDLQLLTFKTYIEAELMCKKLNRHLISEGKFEVWKE